jgi:hypothetical protein
MKTVMELIESFSNATGTRDTSTLKEILHDEYQVMVLTEGGVRVIKKPEYLKMMDDGKIGCTERGLEIYSVQVDGDVAHATFRHIAPSKLFDDTATALRIEGKWKLVFNLSHVTAR